MKIHSGDDEKVLGLLRRKCVTVLWYNLKCCNESQKVHCTCIKVFNKYGDFVEMAELFLEKNGTLINSYKINAGLSVMGFQNGYMVWSTKQPDYDILEKFFKGSALANQHSLEYNKISSEKCQKDNALKNNQNKSPNENKSKITVEKTSDNKAKNEEKAPDNKKRNLEKTPDNKHKNVEKASCKLSIENKSPKPSKGSKSPRNVVNNLKNKATNNPLLKKLSGNDKSKKN